MTSSDALDLGTTKSVEGNYENCNNLIISTQRPVRKNMSMEMSYMLLKVWARSIRDITNKSEEDFDMGSLYSKNMEDKKKRIAKAIRSLVVV